MQRAVFIVAAVLFLGTSLGAQKDEGKKKDRTTQLTLQVLTGENKQPVPNAHVVVRFKEGRLLRTDKRVSWEAKTNRKGVVVFSDVPLGGIKVQVIAQGFQTYGDEHDLTKPEEEVTILLQPPKGQVSAY
jgi:hypothetical protein